MRRWKLMIGGGVVGVGVLAAVYLLACRPGSDINEANFQKLEVGLERPAVERILGGPPRDESSGPLTMPDIANAWTESVLLQNYQVDAFAGHGVWISDWGIISAEFDGQERLEHKKFIRVRRTGTVWDTVRGWLSL